MKNKVSWLPTKLSDFATWYGNFALKFAEAAPVLGFTPAEILAVQQDNATVQWINEMNVAFDAADKRFKVFRDEMLDAPIGSVNPPAPEVVMPPLPAVVTNAAIIDRVIKLAKRIELANGYTKDVGNDLGIIPKPKPQPDVIKPKLKVTALPSFQVELKFTLGKYKAVLVEMQRDGSSEWLKIGNISDSPFIDTTPSFAPGKPEVRTYRIRYIQKNALVGEFSDIKMVTTEM